MKARIMSHVNALLEMLEDCYDDGFVDEVCNRVRYNDSFSEDEIAAARNYQAGDEAEVTEYDLFG